MSGVERGEQDRARKALGRRPDRKAGREPAADTRPPGEGRSLGPEQERQRQKIEGQTERRPEHLHLEEGERTVQSRGAGGQQADALVERRDPDAVDEQEIDESEQRLEKIDDGQRVTECLEEQPQEVGVEWGEVEHLAPDPCAPGDRARPRVVQARVEDQTVEEDAGLRVPVEIERPEGGGGQENEGQGPWHHPGRSQRTAPGLAFAGSAIYCLLVAQRAVHGVSRMRIPQIARRSVTSLALLAACGGLPAPRPIFAQAPGAPGAVRPGAVTALVLPVAGMTCALCTRGVEQSIKLLDEVDAASAELSTGLVRVQAVEGRSLNIRDVKDRVQKAGFKVGGECDVEAIGRFNIGPDGRITFRVPGTAYAFQVLEGSELKRLFRSRPRLKGEVFLVFRLHEHPRWKPAAISIVRGEPRGAVAPLAGR